MGSAIIRSVISFHIDASGVLLTRGIGFGFSTL